MPQALADSTGFTGCQRYLLHREDVWWRDIADRLGGSFCPLGPVGICGVRFHALGDIAPWWHLDGDLGRTIECINHMSKSRRAGFLEYQDTFGSFVDLFDQLKRVRIAGHWIMEEQPQQAIDLIVPLIERE